MSATPQTLSVYLGHRDHQWLPLQVRDLKTVEEIIIKKPKTVVDLLIVTDVCIEASETWARLLESCGKGPAKKK
jgi:hypothetical protein